MKTTTLNGFSVLRCIVLCIVAATMFQIVGCVAHAADTFVEFTFTASLSEADTTNGVYGLYAAPAINQNMTWVKGGVCAEGNAAITVNLTNLPANPCFVCVRYEAGGLTSPPNIPFLFDVRNYSLPVPTNATPTNVVRTLLPAGDIIGVRLISQ